MRIILGIDGVLLYGHLREERNRHRGDWPPVIQPRRYVITFQDILYQASRFGRRRQEAIETEDSKLSQLATRRNRNGIQYHTVYTTSLLDPSTGRRNFKTGEYQFLDNEGAVRLTCLGFDLHLGAISGRLT
jgi:hypothetical protein